MKKFISAITAIAMTAGVMASMTVVANAEEPDGTEANPYLISDVNSWNSAASGKEENAHYKLTNHISPTQSFKHAGATLDMNGYSITTETNKIIEAAGITIKNSSENESEIHCTASSGTNYVMMIGTGDFNIYNVKITCDSGQAICIGGSGQEVNLDISDSEISGSAYGLNLTRGTTTIKNTTVTGTGYSIAASGTAVVTVDSGTFDYTGTVSGVTVGGTSNVTINGGTFTNHNKGRGVINNIKGFAGVLTINGGTFENTDSNGYSILDSDEGTTTTPPVINITGGIFKSGFGFSKPNDTTTQITVTGGIFSFNPSAYVDPAQYDIKEEPQGTWTVSEKGGVEPPTPPTETKYYAVDLGDNAGSYTKVSVTANNGEKDATVIKDLGSTVTLAGAADVLLGIKITDIPEDKAFTITSVTLE